ncbi:hypothetical protein BpHYR1_014392 [Brachionus plicatilis]|uniref:Uncharacterized protein n=1 Tax=Brachionus plicatilis TaxID=10195 RepID=A0A3M7RBC6_BRAPC|nr:hypothetical protein BpHYR1_014392 [Brachionus plicatilis]
MYSSCKLKQQDQDVISFEYFLRFFSNFCAKIGLFLDVLRKLRIFLTAFMNGPKKIKFLCNPKISLSSTENGIIIYTHEFVSRTRAYN